MNFLHYQVYIKVVETKSFTKAADKLGYTQSAVSQMINSLEKDLGVKLLNRSKTGITTTKIGERVLKHIREIIQIQNVMRQEAASFNGFDEGTIRVGTIPSLSKLMPPIIRYFKQHFPGIELIIFEGGNDSVHEWIQNGEIDVGFVSRQEGDIQYIPLLKDELLLFSPKTLFQNHPAINIKSIEEYCYVIHKGDSDQIIQSIFEEIGINPNIRYEIQDVSTILTMVQEGFGLCILPKLALPSQIPNVNVHSLTPSLYRELGIAVKSMDHLSPITAEIILVAKDLVQ
ncbi:LysR family transcriptional regulator [Bacillus sp. 31A1R]|uniref:LysR family transcriptional regulator n=1 Tax=Robertmurraya mangrovi TaxID=3098077 RepID=A0ABU5IWR4_9BACI|nr:LysR family transcriptional regulator [Bacillus sp. 31A1R]MDZ5471576.1 LysR family transcriptional regulator [Bacillus sp. 31A1R]